MKFRNLFKHNVKGGIATTSEPKVPDWCHMYSAIKAEYAATATAHKKPTEYMRGLAFALDVLDAYKPDGVVIAEVEYNG